MVRSDIAMPILVRANSTTVANSAGLIAFAVQVFRNPAWFDSELIHSDWTEQCAHGAFKRYRVFMSLKMAFGDLRSSLFSPTKSIDAVWHRHILFDTRPMSGSALKYAATSFTTR